MLHRCRIVVSLMSKPVFLMTTIINHQCYQCVLDWGIQENCTNNLPRKQARNIPNRCHFGYRFCCISVEFCKITRGTVCLKKSSVRTSLVYSLIEFLGVHALFSLSLPLFFVLIIMITLKILVPWQFEQFIDLQRVKEATL